MEPIPIYINPTVDLAQRAYITQQSPKFLLTITMLCDEFNKKLQHTTVEIITQLKRGDRCQAMKPANTTP